MNDAYKQWRDKLEAAGSDVLADFDPEQEWLLLNAKLHRPAPQRRLMWNMAKIAAVLIFVCAGIKTATLLLNSNNSSYGMPQAQNNHIAQLYNGGIALITATDTADAPTPVVINEDIKPTLPAARKKQIAASEPTVVKNTSSPQKHISDNRTKEFVCNGTPCPLEICIVQSITCHNGQPAAVATCSVLLPDQSGQLRYKAPAAADASCNMNIEEIRITRISTGETILLNASSKPATAQQVFDYMTGQTQDCLLAGVFHTGCDNETNHESLTIESLFGNLVLQ